MRKNVIAVLAALALIVAAVEVTKPAPVGAQTIVGGFAIIHGTLTLDGANPSSVVTGLVAIQSCVVTHKAAVAPADDPNYLTTATAAVAGRLDVYAWKNTGGSDPTLVASTDAATAVDWVCIGLK